MCEVLDKGIIKIEILHILLIGKRQLCLKKRFIGSLSFLHGIVNRKVIVLKEAQYGLICIEVYKIEAKPNKAIRDG